MDTRVFLRSRRVRGTAPLSSASASISIRWAVTLEARIAAPPGTTLAVLRNGTVLYKTQSDSLKLDVGNETGAYHFEAYLAARDRRSDVPWLLTNPIYVGLREMHRRASMPVQQPPVTDRAPLATVTWRAEASPDSKSALHPGRLSDGTPALEWRFSVADGERRNQYAALRFPVERGQLAQYRPLASAGSDRFATPSLGATAIGRSRPAVGEDVLSGFGAARVGPAVCGVSSHGFRTSRPTAVTPDRLGPPGR